MRKRGIIPFHYISVLLSEYFLYTYTNLNCQTLTYVSVEIVEREISLFFFANVLLESISACGRFFPSCGKGRRQKKERGYILSLSPLS